jgi:exopolyphosphatase / guanosine-5'-triphosphate,3'-diphosphate pyrophosphatase
MAAGAADARTRSVVRRAADDGFVSWRSTRAAGHTEHGNRQVAVIDLGSNSWRLVVFTFGGAGDGSWWKRTDELYEAVRIGAGLGESGRLSDEAMARGIETLAVFERFCVANGLGRDDVLAVATSAIREATNRDQFLADAHRKVGFKIEVLSAEDEARYGYVAAVNTSTLTDGVVLEIGGGSMQLIQVADRRAQALSSFELGAVRMSERFLPVTDPARPARKKDVARLRAYVRDSLIDLRWLPDSEPRMVGLGGAVRNLAAAAQHAAGPIELGIQGYVITPEALSELVQTLAALPPAERGGVPGIKPERGDIILAAAVVLETVVELGGFDGLEATEAGLRDGVFLARTLLDGRGTGGEAGGPLFDDVREAAVRNLAIQYESDMTHVEHVARLSLQMHDSLVKQQLFEPKPGERELLWAASMLHDVGMTISYDDHHKHSRYLIVSAELPGFDPRERMLIAQMTRYHRKGVPKLGVLAALAQDGDEELLERCSVILRLAEHLERGRDQSVSEARLRANGHGVDLHLEAAGDLTLPRWSVERYGDGEAFQRVFGRRLLIG